MKRISRLSLLLLLVFSVPVAFAAETKPLKIGVVDLTRVFKEYRKTQAMETQLETLSKGKQAARDKIVAEIKDMKDELALMSDDARTQKRQAFEEKLKGLGQFDQDAKEKLREQRDQAMEQLLKEIEATVETYSKEKEYDLILSDRAILYRADSVDVSGDIIALLNQKYAGAKNNS